MTFSSAIDPAVPGAPFYAIISKAIAIYVYILQHRDINFCDGPIIEKPAIFSWITRVRIPMSEAHRKPTQCLEFESVTPSRASLSGQT